LATKSKTLILDATAFYAGVPYAGLECYKTTAEVLKEVTHNSKYLAIINTLLDSKRLEIDEPPLDAYQIVKAAAADTKDLVSLSKADLSVLALAVHHSKKGDVVIVTDDYAVQNVAQSLGIPFAPTTSKGIKKQVRWVHYCPACSQTYIDNTRFCPICGTTLRRKFGSGKPIKY